MATLSDKRSGWHVIGAGAMGCLWAARLWQRSRSADRPDVTLLLRNGQAVTDYLNAGGIVLHADTEKFSCPVPAMAIDSISGEIANLLVATKAQHVVSALHSISHALTADTRIVLLQNGLRSQHLISTQYGAQRVYCLSTSHGAWLHSPYQVVHAGFGAAWLGQFRPFSDNIQTMLDRLPVQEMNIRHDPDINKRLWHKFAINCAVNALTVVHDCRNGGLLTLPAARQQLTQLCAELEQILAAIPEAPVFDNLLKSVDEVLRDTSSNYSSTLQDVRSGKVTEIADLNGYLVELAQQHGCAAPMNIALTKAVLAKRVD
jgi:2-dehydropantoate 2-reductase